MDKEQAILSAWQSNATPWTRAIRERQIASRVQVTDRAVVEAVLVCNPRTVLDIGCGEGWLVRALTGQGIDSRGIDAVPALIDQARQAGGGRFDVMDYRTVAAGGLKSTFDTVVINFALLGGDSVAALIAAIPKLLNPGGTLVIQTLHPLIACGDQPYSDGWREGSWVGFDDSFTDPAPWYFRTLGSWLALLTESGLGKIGMQEPLHPDSGKPVSVIFTGYRCDQP